MEIAAIAAGTAVLAREETFARFVDRYRDRAVRIAFRMLDGDQGSAEDVAQNAFLRAHGGLPSFRGDSTMDTWFYRILVREVERYRRWRGIRRFWAGDPETAPELIDQRPAGDPSLRRRIVLALDELSHGQREVFVLVHLEEFTVAEAASILGKPIGTVKSHLHRALDRLRSELADLTDSSVKPNRERISG